MTKLHSLRTSTTIEGASLTLSRVYKQRMLCKPLVNAEWVFGMTFTAALCGGAR